MIVIMTMVVILMMALILLMMSSISMLVIMFDFVLKWLFLCFGCGGSAIVLCARLIECRGIILVAAGMDGLLFIMQLKKDTYVSLRFSYLRVQT